MLNNSSSISVSKKSTLDLKTNSTPFNDDILKVLVHGLAAIEIEGHDEEGSMINPIQANFKTTVKDSEAMNLRVK